MNVFEEMCGADDDDVHEAAPLASALLPDGKTCGDCAHFERCRALFQCRSTGMECDWTPHRFRPRSASYGKVTG